MTDRSVRLIRPDDWHLHLRDGAALAAVVRCNRSRLRQSNRHAEPAAAGHDDGRGARVSRADPRRASRGQPLRAADDAVPDRRHVRRRRSRARRRAGFVHAVKYYPAGATTNSRFGRHGTRARLPGIRRDGARGHRACRARRGHRSGRRRVRPRARVRRARSSTRIVRDFPGAAHRARAHHDARGRGSSSTPRRPPSPRRSRRSISLWSRNALFAGGLRPHLYCLPMLKREAHRRALVAAATSGNPKFFLGTDSAPHAQARQGERLRLRRLLFGAARAAALRRGVRGRRRARPARRLREPARRRVLRPAAATPIPITLVREAWRVPDDAAVRRRHDRAAARRQRRCAGASTAQRADRRGSAV